MRFCLNVERSISLAFVTMIFLLVIIEDSFLFKTSLDSAASCVFVLMLKEAFKLLLTWLVAVSFRFNVEGSHFSGIRQ